MSFKEHQMDFGRYCGNLIWGLNQVEIADKNLKRVHDLGVAEIRRQAVDALDPKE